MKPTIWNGCYESNWKGVITSESFAHPAKYSRSLIERIFKHCIERGYLKRDDLCGDCFGGIGTGGVTAAYAGLRWIGCELEPRFVAMAKSNFALHADKFVTMGLPQPTILQGDSRKFDEVVGAVAGVVCSPPYSDIAAGAGGLNTKPATKPGQQSGRSSESASQTADQRYGAAEGQISKLKEGSLSAVVTSPPYSETGRGGPDSRPEHIEGGHCAKLTRDNYGTENGQIGVLLAGKLSAVVTSPPYADSVNSEKHGIDFTKAKKDYPGRVMHEQTVAHADNRHSEQSYGRTEGQIGALHAAPLDGVVTSPPYLTGGNHADQTDSWNKNGRGQVGIRDPGYGKSPAQIGGETYWQAMALVYAACFRAIRRDGIMVCVVKDFVKKGQRVPLCDDTARLMEHCGFIVIERIHAMLVKETTHNDLFSGTTKTKTERKSFFRRLAEKKGSPEINWEEVVIARTP